ncbi:pyridoxamine 5'-phosphate oxidase family protein [Pseudoteredinibacter isoporae]|uniref:pyridoxamine 5'-phosphate oxidase family protein n=1 Tax=Pseudoteredinibacter isoporae TaxID=570281 RepID=UPI003103B621
MFIESESELREIYGYPVGRAKDKQLAALEKHSIHFIHHSPFMLLSTANQAGRMDCSPRGGEPGFVRVLNERCILIPDAKGNRRLDSLVNILDTGSVGCVFLIPGVDETLRVNGRAKISRDASYLENFDGQDKAPISCIVLDIEEVFLHCAKALMRSRLWAEDSKIERSSFPTMGRMINDQLNIAGDVETQEDMVKRYMKDL